MKPKILSEKIAYKGYQSEVILSKIELPNGKIVEWDYYNNADVVCILPIDIEGNVYLVKEWRPAWKDYVTQVPAGHCPSKLEEEIVKQLHNELREETGMDSSKITKLISYAPSAKMNYKVHLFLAQDLFESYKAPDEDELIEVIKIPFKKAYDKFVIKNELTTSSTILALVLAKDLI